MTVVLAPFPDVEALTIAVLLGLDVEGLGVATRVPADPEGTYSWLPFLRVKSIGGSDNRITDRSAVDVDAFAATEVDALSLAEAARQRLISGPWRTDEGVLDRATTTVKPNQVPYGDEQFVVRYTAAYSISTRRP